MAAKVTKTNTHDTGKIVCLGRLELIDKKLVDCNADIRKSQGALFNKQPIIISDTELVTEGDLVAHKEYGIGKVLHKKGTSGQYWACQFEGIERTETLPSFSIFKILALPTNFSPNQLDYIENRNLREDEQVWIECEYLSPGALTGTVTGHYIKLDRNSQVSLFPIRKSTINKSESWEDILAKYESSEYRDRPFINYLRSNYNPPTPK